MEVVVRARFLVVVLAWEADVDLGAGARGDVGLAKRLAHLRPGLVAVFVRGDLRRAQVVAVDVVVGLGVGGGVGVWVGAAAVVVSLPEDFRAPGAVRLPAVAFLGLALLAQFGYQSFFGVDVPGGGLPAALAGGFGNSPAFGVVVVAGDGLAVLFDVHQPLAGVVVVAGGAGVGGAWAAWGVGSSLGFLGDVAAVVVLAPYHPERQRS